MKAPKYPNTQIPKYPSLLTYALALLGTWVLGCLGTYSASAEITATVYPGYQFSANERPTVQQLNLLGRPTILVSGTLGGTNVALAAGSVTTTMMSDTLPGSNLVWDASSPRELVIADDGVDTNQLSSGVAGDGLSGGSGSPLAVNVDTNTITITNDVVTLNLTTFSNLVTAVANVTNTAQYVVTNYASTNLYESSELSIATGKLLDAAHGFATTPRDVWVVLRCKTAEFGYSVGDEVDASNQNNNSVPNYFVGANTTNVFLVAATEAVLPALPAKSDGTAWANITEANWRLVLRAQP